jgi:pyridoxine/pyridoxamine 5'-phosphate oxidase
MPLARFKEDRARAFAAEDPAAALCVVATVDDRRQPQVRTLVLREVDDDLAVFVNATSPKWQQLGNGIAVLTYWPSVQVQYRLSVTTEPVPQEIVAESWQLRPDPPKRMDWYYESGSQQSTHAGSREALLAGLGDMRLDEPLEAPDNARGLYLKPYLIERLDLTQTNGVHDRVQYTLEQGEWVPTTLVP